MIPIYHKADGYKLDHVSQYVPGTKMVVNNMTPRSDKLAQVIAQHANGKMVFFGLQYVLLRMVEEWNDHFFNRPKDEVIARYTRRVKAYVGPDNGDKGIEALGKLHDLGYLPLRVRALPEGSRVPMRVPMLSINNTHDDFAWLVNYTETYISTNLWSMCNAASLMEQYYLTSKHWASVSGAPDSWVAIANHCFAARGHRGDQDAMTSGMAHLLFSIGTDTLWAIDGLEEYYGADVEKGIVGVSVNAFEHATASQRIAHFGSELESVRDIVTNLYPSGIVSYVGDTKDLFYLVNHIMRELKPEILARTEDSLGMCKFVVRPDSSRKSPKEIILGYKVLPSNYSSWSNAEVLDSGESRLYAKSPKFLEDNKDCDAILVDGTYYDMENRGFYVSFCEDSAIPELEVRGVLDILWEIYGGTINDKGLRVLNPKVGLIYGESITLQLQWEIYEEMVGRGWCVSNVLFGVGSWAFLKDSSRDSYGQAIKATASIVNGTLVEMQKTPKTDDGTKHSAKGLIRVDMVDGEYVLRDQQTLEEYGGGELREVLNDGIFPNLQRLSDIRSLVRFKV